MRHGSGDRGHGKQNGRRAARQVPSPAAAIRSLGTVVEQGVEAATEIGRVAASEVRDTARDYAEQGRDQAALLRRNIEQKIGSQPLQALMLAAGAGFLAGLWFRRR